MAIALHEYLESQNISLKVQIFASDISENVISKARAGIYSREEVRNISEERLAAYFTKSTDRIMFAKKSETFVFLPCIILSKIRLLQSWTWFPVAMY